MAIRPMMQIGILLWEAGKSSPLLEELLERGIYPHKVVGAYKDQVGPHLSFMFKASRKSREVYVRIGWNMATSEMTYGSKIQDRKVVKNEILTAYSENPHEFERVERADDPLLQKNMKEVISARLN